MGLIDSAQLEQSCIPCKGERQEKNTNVPVEFRDASPLVLGRYVSYLEQELDRVRAEKDKYNTSLEGQIETHHRHVASLERQVELLQGEVNRLQERCEVLLKEINLHGGFWVNVLREVLRQQPETEEQFEKIIKHFRNIRRQKRTYIIQKQSPPKQT